MQKVFLLLLGCSIAMQRPAHAVDYNTDPSYCTNTNDCLSGMLGVGIGIIGLAIIAAPFYFLPSEMGPFHRGGGFNISGGVGTSGSGRLGLEFDKSYLPGHFFGLRNQFQFAKYRQDSQIEDAFIEVWTFYSNDDLALAVLTGPLVKIYLDASKSNLGFESGLELNSRLSAYSNLRLSLLGRYVPNDSQFIPSIDYYYGAERKHSVMYNAGYKAYFGKQAPVHFLNVGFSL